MRHQAEEIAGAHARLQHAALVEAQSRHRSPHGIHHVLGGVVRVLRAAPGGGQLFRRQQFFQLGHAAFPALRGSVAIAKRLRQPAPAHVARQHGLFGSRRLAAFGLQLLQQLDRRDVAVELAHRTNTGEVQFVGDGEVTGRNDGWRRRGFLGTGNRNPGFGRGFLGFSGLGSYSFSGIPYSSRTSASLRWLFCCANLSAISS